MNFKIGRSTAGHLKQIHDDLDFAFRKALKLYSTVDMGIHSSARTLAEQKKLKATGKSQTLRSRHIVVTPVNPPMYPRANSKNKDGFDSPVSHAIDVLAYVNGKSTWKAEHYYAFAEAMRLVAVKHDIAIRWGGCWKDLRKVTSIHSAVEEYIASCKKRGKRPFLDIGHFELHILAYPRKEK